MNELTLELVRVSDAWWKGCVCVACSTTLRDYFDIPEEAKKLYVKLTKKPAKDRLKINKVDKNGSCGHVYFKSKQEVILVAAYDILKDFGIPCYVEFWWE